MMVRRVVQMRPFQSVRNCGRARTAIPALFLVLTIGGLSLGQDRQASAQVERLAAPTVALPGDLLLQVQRVGERLLRPGKEETVLDGQLLSVGDVKTVRVIHQLSGMVRIEGVKETAMMFDGEFARGVSSPAEQTLLDTFVMDTIEGMIYAARSGGAVRLVGRSFGPDPRVEPRYQGPRYDIYEVIAPVRTRQDRQLQLRRYYFDSKTGLLSKTYYADASFSPALSVETRFSNWEQINDSMYPRRIDRYENGNPVFSIVISVASSRLRQDAAKFR